MVVYYYFLYDLKVIIVKNAKDQLLSVRAGFGTVQEKQVIQVPEQYCTNIYTFINSIHPY